MHVLTEEMLLNMWLCDEEARLKEARKIGEEEEEPDEDDAPEWRNMWGDEMKIWTNRAVREGVLKNVKHGDTIHWRSNNQYRNEGLMFWSKNEGVMFPYTDYDDYGSVPPCFRVGEDGFCPGHWVHKVDHNCIVFLSDALVEKLEKRRKKNKSEGKMRRFNLDIYDTKYTVKIHHDKPIGILFHYTHDRVLEQM